MESMPATLPSQLTVGLTGALLNLVFVTLLLFMPFYRGDQRLTSLAYLVFVVVSSLVAGGTAGAAGEAGGVAASAGSAWGGAGALAHYAYLALVVLGAALILAGWARIYRDAGSEWSSDLIEDGIYRATRHPQYLGFIVVTLGMLLRWPSAPTAVLWVGLAVFYVRRARSEERDLERRFGDRWRDYRARVGMFLPRVRL